MKRTIIEHGRRRLIGTAVAAFAVAKPAASDCAKANTTTEPSFGTLKQTDAGVLSVGYVDAGAATAPVVILLHGWPYDIHSFVEVVPTLVQAG